MKSMSDFVSKSLRKKVMFAVVGGVFLFFALTGIVSTRSVKSLLLKEKYNTIKAISEQVSTQLASGLNKTTELLTTEKASLEQIHQYPRSERRTIIIQNLKNLLENNPDITSIWADWEPLAVDSLDSKMLNTPGATSSGKFCATVYRNDNAIELADYNSDDDSEGEYYTIPKSTRQLYITSPYTENYQTKTDYLIITMALPVILKNEVIGVVGADINISQLNQQIINKLKDEEGRFFIADADQKLLVYDKEEGVGKEISEVLPNDYSKNEELIGAIKSKASGFYDFVDSDGKEYLAYVSQSNILKKDDVSILLIPGNFLTSANLKVFFIAFFILFGLGLLIFYLLTAYIIKKIIDPINMVSAALKKLAEGNYANVSKVDIKTGMNSRRWPYLLTIFIVP
jgi:methyl-accepting chemotaxis protein